MRLILLRHGETHANVSGALDTASPGEHLTDLGRAQATAAAEVLRRRPPGAIFTSPLARTRETAAPLVADGGATPTVLEGLREIRAGDYEMHTDPESRKAYIHVVACWILGDLDVRMPGGEDGHEFVRRYGEAITTVVAGAADPTVVVSHGAAIRTWAGRQVGDSLSQEAATQTLRNTGAIELDGDPDQGWRIVAWHNHPLGGIQLEDPAAVDPTGRAE
ncbi:MAG: histidine phosphatase family protein [Marmoricola sp.]